MNKTEYLLRLRADLIRKLYISRDIINKTSGVNNYDEFTCYAVAEFDNFSDTIPFFKDRNNQFNFSYGPLLLATYRALIKNYTLTEAQAIDTIGQIVDNVARYQIKHMNSFLKILFKKAGKWPFLRRKMKSFFKYRPEPLGWQAIIRQEQDAYVAADMTACGLFQWLSLNDTPQLCKVACDSDYITLEYMPFLTLKRKSTISNGDAYCSFRYIQQDSITKT